MSVRVDLKLNCFMRHEEINYDKDVGEFVSLLRALEKTSSFDLGWSIAGNILWDDLDDYVGYIEGVAKENYPDGSAYTFAINDSYDDNEVFYSLYYAIDKYAGKQLAVDFHRHHPVRGIRVHDMIDVIDAITRWKRPQHLSIGPVSYFINSHPLSRNRIGVGWGGWVPFEISPEDVPEAEIVRRMNEGTLVVTQREFWQDHPTQTEYSLEAIQRAQAVEVRLNSLGVLPTSADIVKGNWGER